MNTLAVIDQPGTYELMSPAALTARLQVIQQTMIANMKEGIDYGKIAGMPKPTLFKPGAEKLCATFNISPTYINEDLSTGDCVRIRSSCIGTHQHSRVVLGSGSGECSTDETKYKWRRPVCDEEYDDTPEDRRRRKWLPGRGGKAYQQKQVRTEPADLANTVLKMANKRAQIAMVLNVTGASAIFSQDLETMPKELRPAHVDEDGVINDEPQPRRQAQVKQNATGAITAKQLQMLTLKMQDAGMQPEQICARFDIASLDALQFNDLNSALAYVADPQMNERA